MRDASDDTDVAAVADGAGGDAPERRCILTGAHGERDQLIRLMPGPDGAVWPDLAAKLPGRGAWVTADAALVRRAMANGRLKGALARAFRAAPPTVPADLVEKIARGLELRALNRLGLEHRAGHLLFGAEKLNEWARAGRIHLLLHAADAADDGVARLDQAFRVGEGDVERIVRLPVGRLALSSALGRDNIVHAGVADVRAAARVDSDIARWVAFLRTEANESAGNRADESVRLTSGQPLAEDDTGASPVVKVGAGDTPGPVSGEGRE